MMSYADRATPVHGEVDANPGDPLKRDFSSSKPDTKLVGDTTYMLTSGGRLHLVMIIDLVTRMLVGW